MLPFTEEDQGILEKLIRDRGASLLMLCGPMHSPGSYAGTPVETMLPVRFEAEAAWETVTETVYPVLTPEGITSQVMTLENDAELNDRVWSRMAPMDQLPPLLSVKPGATLLAMLSTIRTVTKPTARGMATLWNGQVHVNRLGPFVAFALQGRRQVPLAFMVPMHPIHDPLLVNGEHKRVRLETDRSVYTVDDQCRLYAHVLDDEYEPIRQPGFDIYLSNIEEGQESNASPSDLISRKLGLYEGYLHLQKRAVTGLNPKRGRAKKISNSTEFQVAKVSKELLDTNARPDHLKRISELTGGKSLTIPELPSLASL